MRKFFGSSDSEVYPPAGRGRATYWLTRFMILRLLGVVYAIAFLVAVDQLLPLIGSRGLLPANLFVARVEYIYGSSWQAFLHLPSIFWWWHTDFALLGVSVAGLVLSLLVVVGFANSIILALLWAVYISIVHIGQDWYGYGWETQLLETGFLAIFLCPLLDARPFPKREPPRTVIFLFVWLIFRIMLGAGLIKLRGDPEWRDLTILYYHFETQPIPNPLSRFFHFLPHPCLQFGVVLNHLAEIAAPVGALWPHRRVRLVAGAIMIVFQFMIIAGGNLSFLNWLTIVPALACIDDTGWKAILPGWIGGWADRAAENMAPCRPHTITASVLAVVIALLSIQPMINLVSPGQVMNTSYDRLDLVNTYGAFGSVGKTRYNIIFEGTASADPDDLAALWKEYPYKGLPTDVTQRPVQVAPYQLRLDWQMWFAAMGSVEDYPWTLHVIWKLLHNDPGTLGLFGGNPFPDQPPRFIRAVLYEYKFASPNNPDGVYWTRRTLGLWLPALSIDDPRLRSALRQKGWLPPPDALEE